MFVHLSTFCFIDTFSSFPVEREARKCLKDGSLSEIVIKGLPSHFTGDFSVVGLVFAMSIGVR